MIPLPPVRQEIGAEGLEDAPGTVLVPKSDTQPMVAHRRVGGPGQRGDQTPGTS